MDESLAMNRYIFGKLIFETDTKTILQEKNSPLK